MIRRNGEYRQKWMTDNTGLKVVRNKAVVWYASTVMRWRLKLRCGGDPRWVYDFIRMKNHSNCSQSIYRLEWCIVMRLFQHLICVGIKAERLIRAIERCWFWTRATPRGNTLVLAAACHRLPVPMTVTRQLSWNDNRNRFRARNCTPRSWWVDLRSDRWLCHHFDLWKHVRLPALMWAVDWRFFDFSNSFCRMIRFILIRQ